MKSLVTTVAATVIAVACSGGGGGTTTGTTSSSGGTTSSSFGHASSGASGMVYCSCDLRASDNTCTDYTGSDYATGCATTAQPNCAQQNGTYATSACPTANRVGTCTQHQGHGIEGRVRYYPPIDAMSGQQVCTTVVGGVWTPN